MYKFLFHWSTKSKAIDGAEMAPSAISAPSIKKDAAAHADARTEALFTMKIMKASLLESANQERWVAVDEDISDYAGSVILYFLYTCDKILLIQPRRVWVKRQRELHI